MNGRLNNALILLKRAALPILLLSLSVINKTLFAQTDYPQLIYPDPRNKIKIVVEQADGLGSIYSTGVVADKNDTLAQKRLLSKVGVSTPENLARLLGKSVPTSKRDIICAFQDFGR